LSRNKNKSDIEEEQKLYQGGARGEVERSMRVSRNRNKNVSKKNINQHSNGVGGGMVLRTKSRNNVEEEEQC
jgi:hypothetical protein